MSISYSNNVLKKPNLGVKNQIPYDRIEIDHLYSFIDCICRKFSQHHLWIVNISGLQLFKGIITKKGTHSKSTLRLLWQIV
jgi:hypothetical protein